MALEMKNATYARDTAGKKKLLSELKGDVNNAIKALEQTSTVTNEVDKYWLGKDANQFKSSFKSSADEIKALYKKFNTLIENALADDAKQFGKMQETNSSEIAKNIQKIQ